MRAWFARLAGNASQQMLMVAIGWHMYDLTHSAWDLGLVGLFQFIPALLLTLVVGHVVDRFHRARIVAACLVTQGIVTLILMMATLGVGASGRWDSRELLLALSVVLGTARAFQQPSLQALTPMLVPTSLLPRAMAFTASGQQFTVIGAPALGGLIFVAGASAVYATCTVLSTIGFIMLLGVKYEHITPPRAPVSMKTLLAGFGFIWNHKTVLGAISLDLFAVLLGGAVALLPIYAKDILHVGPWGLGVLRGAPAVGAFTISILLTRKPLERKVGKKMLGAVAVFGVCMIVFGLSTNFFVSLFALAISGAADMVSVVVRQTLVQLETPNEMRGRVSSVNSIFIGASNQLGEFESGSTAALLGPVGSVVFGGIATLAIAASWTKIFPQLAKRDTLQK